MALCQECSLAGFVSHVLELVSDLGRLGEVELEYQGFAQVVVSGIRINLVTVVRVVNSEIHFTGLVVDIARMVNENAH